MYEPDSISILDLAVKARNQCRLAWIVDGTAGETVGAKRALQRFGEVVDAAKDPIDIVADKLVALGVKGVTTFADAQIVRAAEIARRLGIPGNSPEVAVRLVDKVAQRDALRSSGVPVPAYCGIGATDSVDEMRSKLAKVPFPAVVKPAVGNGGRDTVYSRIADQALSYINDQRDSGNNRRWIVEQLIGEYPAAQPGGFGDYVSVELVVGRGNVYPVTVTGRMPLVDPFRETGAFIPAAVSRDKQDSIIEMAVAAAKAIGVETGCLHTEIKLTSEGPRIIEVNGRVPGGGIASLVHEQSGVDLIDCAIKVALGKEPVLGAAPASAGISYHFALQPPIDKRVSLVPDYAERLYGIDGVERLDVRALEELVSRADGSYRYLLMMKGRARDHRALLDAYDLMHRVLACDGPC
ncbi:ATP-grasp domain-containing protein [Skermania sp. ID1734]|uniref:ATP-grasp domain-containing protein n=1 Tax=Skermania sp. ID1734 TaxID=2597516 RepID=UPI00117EB0B2|nr:ATP-grasp domain-containing protein [Skermania sp. ID1734]TSE00405.1 ATP-grasp domain-containing protein [Skermania sp. ID1734]